MFFDEIFINISLCGASFFLSLSLFRFSMKLSRAIGAIDLPSGRRIHSAPTARAGGSSFFIAFLLPLSLLDISLTLKLSLTVGGSVIFLVGLLDDARELTPLQKLIGQLGAASIPVFFGLYANGESFPQSVALPIWILLLSNAVNLSDGLDLLAAGSGSAFCLTLFSLSLLSGERDVLWASLLLLFALLGFLPRNSPPAKIFMGDCGSLFIGYTLAILSFEWINDDPSAERIACILLLFAVPLFDTLQSFVRRIRNGKSPFCADKGHLHHKLLALHFTKETASLLLILCSLIFGLFTVILFLK